VSAQQYVEAIARELSRLRGRGLLLSPADSALALAWHAQGVPLQRVLAVLRAQGPRLLPRARASRKGQAQAAPPQISLAVFASALSARPAASPAPPASSLAAELLVAARDPDLPARAQWTALARRADELLAGDPHEQRIYWSLALQALLSSLRELGRPAALQAGLLLRERRARRPPSLPRREYRRSLQLQLLSAASETLSVPPRAFLL
jgi:hypothetical protein